MNTPFDHDFGGRPIVYVKTVDVDQLPSDLREQAGDRHHLYAVHDAEGNQLALVADRKLAFALARQHDYKPVAVH
ncbi:DUF1150 family protein [Pukyongiella litopenaei]|uniref:DUF1150 family protein n=1 Tax=Pukyongiella litopenaei TaxID=2605946 RepID=A0A2S0MRG2_9RHOB|nr:DUF1150 family protein [Pukyongiella litopenaei]AVO38475.1 DUF1150 family protein [Pukyongiella litopenaei]